MIFMFADHEAIVHFPIALVLAAFLFGLIGFFYRRGLFKELIFWNLIIGVIACGASIYSGFMEGEEIRDYELREMLSMHKRNAYMSGGMLVILSVWMAIRKKHMKLAEYSAWMSIFFVAATAIGYQGYMGHEMSKKTTQQVIQMKTMKLR